MDKKEIGHKILTMRKEAGMTQKELAEKLHVTDKAVSKWETSTHFPDISIMEDLSTALGISVVELLGLEHASSEEMIAEISSISLEEKILIVKEIRNRGWLTIVLGIIIWFGMLYASKTLADNGLFGLPQVFTIGMSGFIGVIIANGIVSIYKGRKLLKSIKNKVLS